jgi:hypothetical protein
LQHGKVVRFDTRKLYEAVDARRIERRMSWLQAAREVGVAVASLKHLRSGGRTSFPEVMRIVGWLGGRAIDYTHVTDR